MNDFGKFVWEQAKSREMSLREFADYVGVSSATIVRAVSDKPGMPSIEFLEKLSIATATDICSLLALVSHNGYRSTNIKPDVLVLSNRIEQLPTEVREVIDGIIMNTVKQHKSRNK